MLDGKQFLVVEDEIFSRQQVGRFLDDASLRFAKDGNEGLALLGQQDFALVICDLHMPGLNGLELLKAVRSGQSRARRNLPFLLLTGDADAGAIGCAVTLDVDGYLVKPVQKAQLRSMVVKLAGMSGARIESAEHYAAIAIAVPPIDSDHG